MFSIHLYSTPTGLSCAHQVLVTLGSKVRLKSSCWKGGEIRKQWGKMYANVLGVLSILEWPFMVSFLPHWQHVYLKLRKHWHELNAQGNTMEAILPYQCDLQCISHMQVPYNIDTHIYQANVYIPGNSKDNNFCPIQFRLNFRPFTFFLYISLFLSNSIDSKKE